MNKSTPPKIAVCFFGITRSLSHTIKSIEKNILTPAQAVGEVRKFGHFFEQKTVYNPRSGENAELSINEHELLNLDHLELEPPELCLKDRDFKAISAFGDSWNDSFSSLRNLIHQLHSLDRVTKSAMEYEPDIMLFCRPDLLYHDDFTKELKYAVQKVTNPLLICPNWQQSGGINDRFAIACGAETAIQYGTRINSALDYCRAAQEPLHSEKLVRFVVNKNKITIRKTSLRASRVRAGGNVKPESFDGPMVFALKRPIRKTIKFIIRRQGPGNTC